MRHRGGRYDRVVERCVTGQLLLQLALVGLQGENGVLQAALSVIVKILLVGCIIQFCNTKKSFTKRMDRNIINQNYIIGKLKLI